MDREPFITRPFSICLDMIRVASAFLVMVGHAAQLGLYTGSYPFTIRLQHNCVIVFFVLSGLVIGESVRRDGATLQRYSISRIARIMPVAIPAIAASIVAYLVGQWIQALGMDPNERLTLHSTILPMLFLSEHLFGEGLIWNSPYWSLCYEVWFYVIFGAAVYLRGPARICVLLVCAVFAGPNILILLPVWLIGVGVARFGPSLDISPVRSVLLIAICIDVFTVITQFEVDTRLKAVLSALVPWHLGYAEWGLSDLLIGAAFAMGLVGLRRLSANLSSHLSSIELPVRWAAGRTFSVYLFHWPIICLLGALGISNLIDPVSFLVWLVAILVVCAGIAEITERRTPAIRRAIESALSPVNENARLSPSPKRAN